MNFNLLDCSWDSHCLLNPGQPSRNKDRKLESNAFYANYFASKLFWLFSLSLGWLPSPIWFERNGKCSFFILLEGLRWGRGSCDNWHRGWLTTPAEPAGAETGKLDPKLRGFKRWQTNRKWSPAGLLPHGNIATLFTVACFHDLSSVLWFMLQTAGAPCRCTVYNTVAGKVIRRVKEIHVHGFDSGLFGETKYEGVISWYPGMKYWKFIL